MRSVAMELCSESIEFVFSSPSKIQKFVSLTSLWEPVSEAIKLSATEKKVEFLRTCDSFNMFQNAINR